MSPAYPTLLAFLFLSFDLEVALFGAIDHVGEASNRKSHRRRLLLEDIRVNRLRLGLDLVDHSGLSIDSVALLGLWASRYGSFDLHIRIRFILEFTKKPRIEKQIA